MPDEIENRRLIRTVRKFSSYKPKKANNRCVDAARSIVEMHQYYFGSYFF